MLFCTTTDSSTKVPFSTAVTRGMPEGGGLFIPASLSPLPRQFWADLPKMDRQSVCTAVAEHLLGPTIEGLSVADIVAEAISFDAPLVPVTDRIFSLELFHGPTAAFKDFGARFLAGVATRLATTRGDRNLTILVATSGDTGGAVAHSFWRRAGAQVVILYPAHLVSPLQERQFASLGDNVHALRVHGTFDACQALVKRALSQSGSRHTLQLTSANSINVARLLPQIFYYVLAHQQWLTISDQPWVCSVPCGNFGNLTAGLYAQRLGLPIARFVAATNANATVPEFLAGAPYTPRPSIATISNAMDVGDPSNFPRIQALFGGDSERIRAAVAGEALSDQVTRDTMRAVYEASGYILDPHGAVAYHALSAQLREDEQGIFLHTAHPAKFGDVVRSAIGVEPSLPPQLSAIVDRKITAVDIGADFSAVEGFLGKLAGQTS